MASHHHPCHHATRPAACYYHYCCSHHLYHPPPPPDSHLHNPPHQAHLYSYLSHLPNLPQYHESFRERYFHEGRQPQPTVSSLIRRIATLESALRRRSSHASSSQSLRDVAARTIQTHFRAFLSRRSRTLRQLKNLASIKSTLGVLKSSVSEKPHFDYDVIHHKATDLLLRLDIIQDGDPMIRNGKSSISRELNKFLDFIGGFSRGANMRYRGNNKNSWASTSERKSGNVEFGDLKRVEVEKLRSLAERIDKLAEELGEAEVIQNPNHLMIRKHSISGNRSGCLVKQNEKVCRVLRRHNQPLLEVQRADSIDRDCLVDDERELQDDLRRGIEEIGLSSKEAEAENEDEKKELHLGNEGFWPCSNGEKDSRSYGGRKRHEENDADDFIFCDPLPVKTENIVD